MKKFIRSFVVLPLLALALVAVPAVLLSFLGDTPTAVGQTVPPPTGTIPQSPLPTPRPTVVLPPPAVVPPRVADLRVRANGFLLEKVIGDRQSSTIYGVAFRGRLFRTENNGGAWELVITRPRFDTFLMSPADPFVLYTSDPLSCDGADSESFFRSDDGGVSWEDTDPGMPLHPLLANSDDSYTVLAAACDGLYVTYDGGESWSSLSTSADDSIWDGIIATEAFAAYFAGDPDDVPTWDVLYVVADTDGGDIVLNSIDGGATWTVITPVADDTEFDISSITGDPTSAERAWFADEQGVWSTEDGGNLWGLSSVGLSRVLARGLNDIQHHPDELLLLATGRGLFSKDTHETEWSQLGRGVFLRLNINDLLFTDSLENKIWLNAVNGVFVFTLP